MKLMSRDAAVRVYHPHFAGAVSVAFCGINLYVPFATFLKTFFCVPRLTAIFCFNTASFVTGKSTPGRALAISAAFMALPPAMTFLMASVMPTVACLGPLATAFLATAFGVPVATFTFFVSLPVIAAAIFLRTAANCLANFFSLFFNVFSLPPPFFNLARALISASDNFEASSARFLGMMTISWFMALVQVFSLGISGFKELTNSGKFLVTVSHT